MPDKPNSNQTAPQETPDTTPDAEENSTSVGGDNIVVQGNVSAGGVVGRGTVHADYIAGGDINIGGQPAARTRELADLMNELRTLIIDAHKSGELNEQIASKALNNLTETAEMLTQEESPPKGQIMRRLQYVADVLDMAADLFTAGGGPAKILLKALPVANMLIKVAARML
jgi:hypothetical protein